MRLVSESVKYLEFLLRHIKRAEPISCLHGFLIRTPAESIRVLYTSSKFYCNKARVRADSEWPFIYNFAFRRVWVIHPKLAWDALIFRMDGSREKAAVAIASSIVESHIGCVMFR